MRLYNLQKKTFELALVLICFLFVFSPLVLFAATLSITPSNGAYEVGDIVTLKAVVSSDTSLNAVSGNVLASPEFFTVESVSKSGSVLDFWVTDPTFNKATGIINFEGVALKGFQGSSGTVVTIKLKMVKAGSGKISFRSGQVLANDGQGTDITSGTNGAEFDIAKASAKPAPKVEEPTPKETTEVTEAVQSPPSLRAPEIMYGTKYGNPSVAGASDYPKSQVVLTFAAKDGSKIFITGIADPDGSFNLVVPNSLKAGYYDVNAVMVKEDKTNSEKSNSITVKVDGDESPWTNPKIFWPSVFLVLVVLYFFARVYHHFSRDKETRRQVKAETREAENITRKSFNLLRDDISDYEENKSPAVKSKIVSNMKRDIDDAEKIVKKEIEDIESV